MTQTQKRDSFQLQVIHTAYSRSCALDTNTLAEIGVGMSKSFVLRIDYAAVIFFFLLCAESGSTYD